MLPTKGFFKDIDCPYHDRTCGRPYCHFRHRKKTEIAAASTSSAPNAVPTYKPTPKSELAGNRSHIPISYIPDVVRTAGPRRQSYNLQDRPTYKPTPKSVLSVVNKDNASVDTPKTYTPTPIDQLKDVQVTEINLDEEFKLIDDILSECTDEIKDSNIQEDESDKRYSTETCIISTAKTEKSDQISVVSTTEDEKKGSKEKDKDKDREKEKSRDDRSKDRHKDREKDRKSDKHKSDREKDKDKDRKSSSSSSRSSKNHKRSSSSSSRSKSSSHSTHSTSKSSSKSSSSHKDKDRDKHRSSSSSKHKSDSKSEQNSKYSEQSASIGEFLSDADDFFDDDIDMDSTNIEDECLKIFNDYKAPEVETLQPPEPLKVLVPDEEAKEEAFHGGKKRIAYNNAVKDEVKARPVYKSVMSAGMTLQNRIRIAHQAQANNEALGIMAEVKSYKRTAHVPASSKGAGDAKRARPNGVVAEKVRQPAKATPQEKLPSTSVIDDILNAKSTTVAGTALPAATGKPPIRRFAPASNVMSIQQAKARIDEIRSRTVQAGRTLATTVAKGAQRAAHVPDLSLHSIPDVLQAERSKLPVNVRTRYLCLLADECVKLYVSTEEAYNRALNEEFKCYERCKALPTYRNSAMLAVNRLRKEAQERDAAGLGPLQVGEVRDKSGDSHLDGKKFYEHIKSFLLSDEELIQHGFPREGPTPGRAVINNEYKQQHASDHLDENQRLCCRCHKIYPINRDGYPLFEEECCYHPMRKRTIRGERMYLCCKSAEDTGCVVSGTHVSEVSADRELEGFQSTFDSERADDPRDHAVYALDCEMCYTTKGLELTRVTVVNSQLKTVYESLVKPINPIVDYNTRFSGITAEHMANTTTNILQIQATILHLCSSKTILIGHSLESDMKALKIIHSSVVDTSVMFPHKFGLPHKRALRVLASEYLKKIIQNDVGGHDSAEDALAAMELVVWKVKEDLKVKGIKA